MSAATLAHAMSRMSPMAANVATSAGRMDPSSASRMGVTDAFRVLSHSGTYSKRWPIVAVNRASWASIFRTSCPGAVWPRSV